MTWTRAVVEREENPERVSEVGEVAIDGIHTVHKEHGIFLFFPSHWSERRVADSVVGMCIEDAVVGRWTEDIIKCQSTGLLAHLRL